MSHINVTLPQALSSTLSPVSANISQDGLCSYLLERTPRIRGIMSCHQGHRTFAETQHEYFSQPQALQPSKEKLLLSLTWELRTLPLSRQTRQKKELGRQKKTLAST